MGDRYDTIIVGAGPADSILAYELARQGVRTLLVDREPFPRYKTRGGGVNERAVRLLDFPISPVVEQVIESAWITYKLRGGFTRPFPQATTYMTMRDKLDTLLVDRAVSAGS